jgi:hypothetical protein
MNRALQPGDVVMVTSVKEDGFRLRKPWLGAVGEVVNVNPPVRGLWRYRVQFSESTDWRDMVWLDRTEVNLVGTL